MRKPIIAAITVIVLFVLFVVLCTFVRRPYEKVLLTRFGSLVPEEKQARIMYNWYLKLPTDGIERIDTRLHLNPGTLQEVAIKGKDTISVRAFAAWRIVDPVKFYRTINADDEIAKKNMDAKIQGLVHSKLSTHTLDELFNPDETKVHAAEIEAQVAREATYGGQRLSIIGSPTGGTFTLTADGQTTAGIAYNATAADVKAALQALANIGSGNVDVEGNSAAGFTIYLNGTAKEKTLAEDHSKLTGGANPGLDLSPRTTGMSEQGIEIVEVGFSRLAFSPNNAEAVYRRMVAELSRQAVDFETRGKAAADVIRAEGKQKAAELVTKAQAEAAAIRGDADSKALQLIASVQTSPLERDFYQKWKSLEMIKTNFAVNTIFVLPSDSPWISPIMKSPVNGQFIPPTTMPSSGASAAPGPLDNLRQHASLGMQPND